MEKLDGVCLGPLGENRLLCNETVAAVGGALVQDILGTFVTASGFVVVIRNLPVAFRSERKDGNRKAGYIVIVLTLCRT